MQGNYGAYTSYVLSLDRGMENLMSVWEDETAATYGCMNENIFNCIYEMWSLFTDVEECLEAVSNAYDPSEVDNFVRTLQNLAEAV